LRRKKRKARNKKIAFVTTYCWCLLLLIIGLLPFLFGNPEGGMSDRENRTLQAKPVFSRESWRDGSFTASLENYLADQLPARNLILDAASEMLDIFSVITEEEKLLDSDMTNEIDAMAAVEADRPTAEVERDEAIEQAGTIEQEETVSDSVTEDVDTPTEIDGEVWKLYYKTADGDTQTIMQFGINAVKRTAKTLEMYRDALPEDGTVTFAYVPYAQVANEWLFSNGRITGWHSEVEPILQAHVGENIYIAAPVNILEEKMVSGESVFFKTDHHWAPRGASYVQQDIILHRGTPTVLYDDFSYAIHESFGGSIASKVRASSGSAISDRLEIPLGFAPTRAFVYRRLDQLVKETPYMETERKSYSAILGGTHTPFYVVETGFHTGRNALIICDSFGNAFLPYLTPYYDKVCLADLREEGNRISNVREYMEHYGIDDVYFVVATGCGINSSYMGTTARDCLE